jgi:hypothetical protein
LPVVGKFRLPARYLVLVYFGLAAIASVALARFLRQTPAEQSTRGETRPLWRLAIASAALAAAGPGVWQEHVAPAWLVWLGPVLIVAAASTVTLCLRQVRGAQMALIVLTALDLGLYGLSYAVYPNAVRWEDYVQASAAPPLTTGFRVATDLRSPRHTTVRTGNRLLVGGFSQIDGYAGLEPRRQLDYWQLPALQAAGVQWVANRPQTRQIDGLLPHDERWLEVPDPLPRVRCRSWPYAPHEESHHAEHDVNHGEAHLIHERPGELHIAVDAPDHRLLIIAESFHHGWQALIDGRPVELLRAEGDFMGCAVELGRHEVRLSFRPASLLWGRRLSLAALLGIGLMFLLTTYQGAMSRPRPKTVDVAEQELAYV